MTPFRGEMAALGTALSWSAAYVLFSLAVRGIGPKALNRLRLVIALLFLLVANLVAAGEPFPLHAGTTRLLWLILSGVIGFAISDAMFFRALLALGPHRTSLVMALVPVVSALLAWAAFGEVLTLLQAVAILVTLAGIVLVLWQREGSKSPLSVRRYAIGILFGLGASLAQSCRYILSKEGMAGGFPALSANVVQILAATVSVWLWTLARGEVRSTLSSLKDRTARLSTVGGAFTGPFLGVTLSLVALQLAPVGVASTLMALSPVLLLPLLRLVFKEPIRPRAVVGTVVAMAGVAMLFLA